MPSSKLRSALACDTGGPLCAITAVGELGSANLPGHLRCYHISRSRTDCCWRIPLSLGIALVKAQEPLSECTLTDDLCAVFVPSRGSCAPTSRGETTRARPQATTLAQGISGHTPRVGCV